MLRANVGLSRKLSHDFNSTGFSVNLDGEISASLEDAEAVLEQLQQLWHTAEEALNQQIERIRGESPAARTSEPAEPRQPQRASNGRPTPTEGEPATNKQIQYLLSIGRRQRLNTVRLEEKVAELLGKPVGLYDLSKRDAGQVIDALSGGGDKPAPQARTNGRVD